MKTCTLPRSLIALLILILPILTLGADPPDASQPEAALVHLDASALARIEAPIRAGHPLRLPMILADARMTLDLQPYSSRAANFRVELRGVDGVRELPSGPVRTYRGRVLEIPGSQVVGILRDGGLKATLLLADQTRFFIEPLPRSEGNEGASWHRISPCGGEEGAICGAQVPLVPGYPGDLVDRLTVYAERMTTAECASNGNLCVADILCDTDFSLYQAVGSSAEAVQDYVEEIMAYVNPRFEDSFNIRHVITQIVIRDDSSTDPYTSPTTAQEVLSAMLAEWPSTAPTGDDLIHLFMSRFVGVGGAAWIGGVCNLGTQGMRSFSSGNGTVTCNRAGLMIHELGHAWGANHQSTGMMAPGQTNCLAPWNTAAAEIEARRDQVASSCLTILAPGEILDDDFESADFSAWSTVETDGGDLAVTTAAAQEGSWGLEAVIDDQNDLFVRSDLPTAEKRVYLQFRIDPSDLVMSGNKRFKILQLLGENPTRRLLTVTLRRLPEGDDFSLRAKVHADDGSWVQADWVDISGTSSSLIAIEWIKSGFPGDDDGSLEIWLNGSSSDLVTGIDNDRSFVDAVRLGVLGGVETDTSGSLYFDDFQSSR